VNKKSTTCQLKERHRNLRRKALSRIDFAIWGGDKGDVGTVDLRALLCFFARPFERLSAGLGQQFLIAL
jgi:hypothetical protein